MPEISLSSRLNPNPCSDGAERANWQNLIEILEIIEQFFHFEITEDNSQYILNIGPIENIETNNINIENFEIGGDIVVNSITSINYYGPGGEICWEHCYCQWRNCLGIDLIPETLCFEASVDSPDCPDPVSGELMKFRDPCGELIWSTGEDGAVEICCECPPPLCCGCPDTPMSGTSVMEVTLTGALTGTYELEREDLAGNQCAHWHGTLNSLGGGCASEFEGTQITVSCTDDPENPMEVALIGGGGACAFNLSTLTKESTTCLEPGFSGEWSVKTRDLMAGGDPPCGCGEDIFFSFVEKEPA